MRQRQELALGLTGQTFYLDAESLPSSITVTVSLNSAADATVLTVTDSIAVDTTATTVSSTSGKGQTDPRKVNIASSTAVVVGRRYSIVSTLGQSEVCEVTYKGTGYVLVRHELQNSYLSTSTFSGVRMIAVVNDAWAAASANLSTGYAPIAKYRARIAYTAGAVKRVGVVYLDLVRYQGRHGVNALDVDMFHPGFVAHLPTEYREDQGRTLINAAEIMVSADLRGMVRAGHAARDAEAYDLLVVEKANVLSQEHRLARATGGSLEAVDAARTAYQDRLDTFVKVSPFDTTGTGATTTSIDRSAVFEPVPQ